MKFAYGNFFCEKKAGRLRKSIFSALLGDREGEVANVGPDVSQDEGDELR
jgi:hypothetical protein